MKAFRLSTVMLCSMTMAYAFAHAMEMPAKMSYEGTFYMEIHHSLYRMFGAVGGPIEVGSILALATLAYMTRHRHRAFKPTVIALSLFFAAHVVFWIVVEPMNRQIAQWTAATIPADWTEVRSQWEYGHIARAVLMLAGMASLTRSILAETPTTQKSQRKSLAGLSREVPA